MKKEGYYKNLFLIGAIFNWVVALLFLIADKNVRQLVGIAPSQDQLSWTLLLIFVFIFGVGYYWVSVDIHQNRNIAKLGIMGKLSVVILYSIYYFRGNIPLIVLLFVLPDLIFALLFIEFILSTANNKYKNAE